jgi:hypothetical protein
MCLILISARFYQNDFLFDYSINYSIYAYFVILCSCIQGGLQLVLTSNPWVWKVTARGGESGDKNFKN